MPLPERCRAYDLPKIFVNCKSDACGAVLGTGNHAVLGTGNAVLDTGNHVVLSKGYHAVLGTGNHAVLGVGLVKYPGAHNMTGQQTAC
jgi:hypothetical protein